MNDLISVIIPVYNTPIKLLDNCLKSVFRQTYENLEILIIDDGSTDDYRKNYNELINNEKRVKLILKKNTGVSDTRNYGITNSNGKYIMFVDSDDYIGNDYIESLYKVMKSKNVKVVASGATIVNENFKPIRKISLKCSEQKMNFNEYIDDFINNIYFICTRILFEKDVIIELFDTSIKYGEDMLFTFNIVRKNSIVYVQNFDYYNVNNSCSATNSFKPEVMEKYIADNVKMFGEMQKYFPEKEEIINNRMFTKLNIAAIRAIRNPNTKYQDFINFIKKTQYCVNIDKVDLKKITYVSWFSKIELILLLKKQYRIYYLLIKLAYKMKK